MPLEAPKLDRRTFDDILREALLRIPRYTPEWTDFNDSDPGVTLLQLHAWLTEMMLFEINRVPERNYIKFLQLLDMELKPAQPAIAHLTVTVTSGTAPTIDRYAQVSAQNPETGELLIFETETGLDLVEATLTDVKVYDGGSFSDFSETNVAGGMAYRPFGWTPQINNALYLGFTPLQPPSATPFPQQMRFRVYMPTDVLAGVAQSCETAVSSSIPPVDLVWEYKMTADAQRWRRLNVYEDETAAFTQEGYIVLEGPQQIALMADAEVDEARYWLRCRLASESYPAGLTPEIDFIRANAVEVKNLTTVRQEILGESEGHPDQLFTLNSTPVVADSLQLVVELEGQERQRWQPVDSLLRSCHDDRHYMLNPNRGEIRFGNGRQGQIPTAGGLIVAYEYRAGGGKAGNVGAGLIATAVNIPGSITVTNERPAIGGRDEQAVEELKAEAPFRLRSRNRAVTVDDFTALAQQAGGIAKAKAIAQAHPGFPDATVPGAVTVVIVPDNNERQPQPSAAEIRHMCHHLEAYRLLTTEVYVKGPAYQSVKVEVKVMAQPYAAFDKVTEEVIVALDEFLDPLGRKATGERIGDGWEFGREFYPNALFSVLLGVKDVVAVDRPTVIINGRPHDDLNDPVIVPQDGLIYSAPDHEITVVPAQDR